MVQQNGRVAKPTLEGSGSFALARKERENKKWSLRLCDCQWKK
jgi:hypothetical protein